MISCSSSAARQTARMYAIVIATACVLGPVVATAASQRTFVASYGKDTDPCSLALPCRSFNVAIGNTNPGGEVVILDTAAYGVMTINKSIKVIHPGVYGGISVLGGANPTTGIVINAGDNDDITLRGLDIGGVPNGAPFPDIGIDIQNAGAVHIEKTSVGNFTQGTSACIKLDTPKAVRLYVDDSFLRECRTAVFVNGNAVPAASSVSAIIDNTRIERGKSTVSPFVSVGVWFKNHGTMQIRNSVISRNNTGVLYETDLPSSFGYLMITGTHLTRHDDAIVHTKAVANAYTNIEFNDGLISTTNGITMNMTGTGSSALLSVKNSQILHGTTPISVNNVGVGHGTFVRVTDSVIGRSTNGIQFTNTAADVNTRAYLNIVRSELFNVSNSLVDVNSANGSKTYVDIESSSLSNATNAVNTAGTSLISASVVRSQINNVTTVLNHGNGTARFDANHIVKCANDFVNNGSGNVFSFNNNAIHDVDNTSGLTYITPAIVTLR